MKKYRFLFVVVLFAALTAVFLSGCVTVNDGVKITNKRDSLDFNKLVKIYSGSGVTAFPQSLGFDPAEIEDGAVKAAFEEVYYARPGGGYGKKDSYSVSDEDEQMMLTYLTSRAKNVNIGDVLDAYGAPSLYEYEKTKNRITVNYMHEHFFGISLGIITFGNLKYICHQFVFAADSEDVYNSPLVSCKQDTLTGKYYGGDNRPPFREFLDSFYGNKSPSAAGSDIQD